jgi:hypothetical protein
MDALLRRRLLATESYYKVAEEHTNRCKECQARLIEDFLRRWEHMTGEVADRRGSTADRATLLGFTWAKKTEEHTNGCDPCLEISVTGFEERFAHSASSPTATSKPSPEAEA